MKSWGLSKGTALVMVLAILASAVIVLPQGAEAQGKNIWGVVYDCSSNNPVGARVTLADAHAQISPVLATATSATGFYIFRDPKPSYYTVQVQPDGFTHFTAESAVFRFDGLTSVQRDICVDAMPTANRWLNITVVDAQPAAIASEPITFIEFSRGPENATQPSRVRFDRPSGILTLDTKPLKDGSAELEWVDLANPLGLPLVRNTDFSYNQTQAFNGQIQITNPTVWTELNNTIGGGAPKGWLTAVYTNVSQSSSLVNGQITSVLFKKNGVPMPDYTPTLEFNAETGDIRIIGNWTFGLDSLTADYSWRGAIDLASVTVIFTGRPEPEPVSATLRTNPAGKAFARVWDGAFDLKVAATGYPLVVPAQTVAGDTSVTILLSKGWNVRVLATDGDNPILASDGLTGVLVNPTANREIRVLPGAVQDNQVSFSVPNGNYLLFVDANGKRAFTQPVTVNNANVTPITAVLSPAWDEVVRTDVVFNNNDWNTITVYRNLTLLEDSVFAGIPYENLRSLRWQIDFEFGAVFDGNIADALPGPNGFNQHLLDAGPKYVVTDEFFQVNSKTYKSNGATFTATASESGTNVTIRTTAQYTLVDPSKPIDLDKPKYYVNVTTFPDKNETVYQNYTYFVHLPAKYEMTSRTLQGDVVTRDFVVVEADPAVATGTPKANLIVEKSLTGVARAEVEGPAGQVSVRDADQAKYKAWVANNTAIIFSANKTTDRLNVAVNAKDATFTWRFTNGSIANDDGTGIWTTFNYTTNGGEWTVNLTVTQVNPTNVTWRDITVVVDNLDPFANFKTNKTGDTVNPTAHTLNEDQDIRFLGADSTDNLYGTVAGEVSEWSWDFDSDGTVDKFGKTTNWTYSKPGTYTMTLFVKDFVGHRSANRTMVFTVLDVTPPSPDFVILDQETWREATQLTEGITYVFNASRTTDNSLNSTDDNVNLTYLWKWGDGTSDEGPCLGASADCLNTTKAYAKYGTDYKLTLNVTDAAGKVGTLTRTIVVAANATAHPDISIMAGTFKASTSNPEEGAQVTFTLNITNAKGKETAQNLKAVLAIVERGVDRNQTGVTVEFLENGTVSTTLAAEEILTVRLTWNAPAKVGNHSLKITVYDEDEPTSWVNNANSQTASLLVREAGWKFWALVGFFLFLIIGVPLILYVRRKFKAGEWELRRKREEKDEEEDEEEEEDEDEGKGKKRL